MKQRSFTEAYSLSGRQEVTRLLSGSKTSLLRSHEPAIRSCLEPV